MFRNLSKARLLFSCVNFLIYAYIIAPVIIIVVISLSSSVSTNFPPPGFSFEWYKKFAGDTEFVGSTRLSFLIAVITCLSSGVLGTIAGFVLDRYRFYGRDFLITLFLSPLMIPQLVFAISLLQFYIKTGTPTFIGLVVGHIVVTLPYMIRSVTATLQNFDITVEHAAISLGATPFEAVMRITLPSISMGIIAGALFSFIISFENLPVSLFVSNAFNITLPVRIFTYIEWVFDPTVAAASTVQIMIVLGVMLILEKLVGVSRFLEMR
jgi:putative spermidine/putrescine transport system permease protein